MVVCEAENQLESIDPPGMGRAGSAVGSQRPGQLCLPGSAWHLLGAQ